MHGMGGLFSIILKDAGLSGIERFCDHLGSILMAVSWGGYESLAMPACAGITEAEFDPKNERQSLIRMYIGLEEADYLIADIEQALAWV